VLPGWHQKRDPKKATDSGFKKDAVVAGTTALDANVGATTETNAVDSVLSVAPVVMMAETEVEGPSKAALEGRTDMAESVLPGGGATLNPVEDSCIEMPLARLGRATSVKPVEGVGTGLPTDVPRKPGYYISSRRLHPSEDQSWSEVDPWMHLNSWSSSEDDDVEASPTGGGEERS